METVDIHKTFGALLLGGLFASLLSGLVVVQVIFYFKNYTTDFTHTKILILLVWMLDTGHTAFIWSALWRYFIEDYGHSSKIDTIHWNLAVTIVFTALLTFFVHVFFSYRIFILSERNYWLTVPIVTVAFLRLLSASVTMGEMLHLETFSRFKQEIKWIFTTGLALSTAVDIVITASLFALLQSSRTGTENLNAVIDSLMWYAFETGSLTCAGTIIAMICWLAMSNNLIFMGLHFVIGKFYAISLLVTLNSRANIRKRSQESGGADSFHVLDTRRRRDTMSNFDEFVIHENNSRGDIKTSSKLEISVQRSITFET